MPFVKLDQGILSSTLWIDRECRDLFITALLMAEPRETREPMPQLTATGTGIAPTGFVVPPGWYGLVPAAGPGICRQALVDTVIGLIALKRLGDPDPESRSTDFEGRRMVRVDGGYLILNFIKYRDRDATAAERSKRWRERQKLKESTQTIRVSRDMTRVIRHQAEAEAEAEAVNLKSKACISKKPDIHGKSAEKSPALCPDPQLPNFDEDENPEAPQPTKAASIPYSKIVDLYHSKLPGLRHVSKLTDARKAAIRQRWIQHDLDSLDSWGRYFDDVSESKFLMGKVTLINGHKVFRADLEWLCKDANFTKVLEGKYHE